MTIHSRDLFDVLAEHERLMTWWEGFLASCADRAVRRHVGQQIYRNRALRTHRARMEAATAFRGETK